MKTKDINDETVCFETFIMLKKTRKLLEEKLKVVRKDCDLKSIDIQILYYIQLAEDYSAKENKKAEIKMADISERMDINKGQLSTALERLVTNKYLESTISKTDKRVTYYKLSSNGKNVGELCKQYLYEFNKQIMSEVTEEELQIFKKVFLVYLSGIKNKLEE